MKVATLFLVALLATVLGSVSAKNKNPLCSSSTSVNALSKCHLATVNAWNSLLFADPEKQLQDLVDYAFTFMHQNITCRVTPVGTFRGALEVAEYVAIFASPSGPFKLLTPTNVTVKYFVSEGDTAFAGTDITFMNTMTQKVANMSIWMLFEFDKSNMVINVDFSVQRYAEFQAELGAAAIITADPSIAETFMMGPICEAAMQYCNGTSKQYESKEACVTFLKSIPLDNPDSISANTVTCRYMHSGLVPMLPAIHCPHVGPTGGKMCMNAPYEAYYSVFTPGHFFAGPKGSKPGKR